MIAVVAALAACWTVFSLVWAAPAILAELLLDSLLAGGLYRVLKAKEPATWLETAFKRTVLPFGLVAILMAGLGGFLQVKAPDAVTMGGAIRALHEHTN